MPTPPAHVQFINPPTLPPSPGWTQVVQVTGGRTVYLSGQTPLDAAGQLVGGSDFKAQAEQVFQNIQAALTAVGADFNNVVKLNVYLLDTTNLLTFREVRNRYVNTQSPPASTLVAVRQLAGEGWLLEVEAIASLAA